MTNLMYIVCTLLTFQSAVDCRYFPLCYWCYGINKVLEHTKTINSWLSNKPKFLFTVCSKTYLHVLQRKLADKLTQNRSLQRWNIVISYVKILSFNAAASLWVHMSSFLINVQWELTPTRRSRVDVHVVVQFLLTRPLWARSKSEVLRKNSELLGTWATNITG